MQFVLHRVAPILVFRGPSAAVSGPHRKNSPHSCERARMVVSPCGRAPVIQRAAIANYLPEIEAPAAALVRLLQRRHYTRSDFRVWLLWL